MATTQTQKSIKALEKQASLIALLTKELSTLKRGTREYDVTLDNLNKAIKKGNSLEAQSLQVKQQLNKANSKHAKSIKDSDKALRSYNAQREKAVALEKRVLATQQRSEKERQRIQRAWNKRSRDRVKQREREQKQIKREIAERIKLREKEARQKERQNAKGTGSQEGFLGGIGSRIGSYARFLAAAAAISAVIKTLNELFIQGFKRAAEFNKAIADMAAITGVAVSSLSGLKEEIKSVAASTTFSVKEIASYAKAMGRLGFSLGEIKSSMFDVAQAAQAMGVSIDEVGEVVGKTLNAFGLGSGSAGRVTNTLLGALNTSALTFEGFGTAMQYVAPIAEQLNVTLEETTAMMAILADSGFKASKIGTGLRTVFLKLGAGSEDLIEKLKELKDANISVAEAQKLVGTRAAAQFLTLLNGVDTIDKLTDAYAESDRVATAAAKQMNTDVERVKQIGVAFDLLTQKIGGAIQASKLFQNILKALDPTAFGATQADQIVFGEGGIGGEQFRKIVGDKSLSAEDKAIAIFRAQFDNRASDVDIDVLRAFAGGASGEEAFGVGALQNLTQDQTLLIKKYDLDNLEAISSALIDKILKQQEELIAEQELKDGAKAVNRLIFGTEEGSVADGLDMNNYANVLRAVGDEMKRISEIKLEKGSLSNTDQGALDRLTSMNNSLRQWYQIQVDKEEELAAIRKKDDEERLAEFNANLAGSRKGEDVARNAIRMMEEMDDWRAILDDYGVTYDENMGYNEMKVFMKVEFPSSKQIEDEARKLQRDVANVFRSTLQDAKNGTGKFADSEGSEEGGVNALGEMLGITDENRDDVVLIATAAVDATSDILRHAMRQRRNEAQDIAAGELSSVKNNYDLESQLLKDKLEKDLLTEQAYRAEIEKLNEERAAKENEINKRRFEAEMEYDKKLAAARFAEALGKIVINNLAAESTAVSIPAIAVGVGMATTAFATELSAINSREFVPTKFEQGGIIGGQRHSQGGTIIEAERDEYIINRGSTLNNLGLVKSINDNPNVSFERSFADMSSTLAMIEKNTSNPKQSYLTDRDMRDSNTRQRIHRNNISI